MAKKKTEPTTKKPPLANPKDAETYAKLLESVANNLDLARAQSVKPKHLYVNMYRSLIQAGRITLAAMRDGYLPDLMPVGFFWKDKTDNESMKQFWVWGVFRWLRKKAPVSMKGEAGVFDFPPMKFNEDGQPIDKDGNVLKLVHFEDGGWKWEGKQASVVDDYDEEDWTAHLRAQSGDHADAARTLGEILRRSSAQRNRTEKARQTRSEETKKRPWHPVDDCIEPLAKTLQDLHKPVPPKGLRFVGHNLRMAYRKLNVETCRRWLEFYISPEYAKAFDEKVQTPLKQFEMWDMRIRKLGYDDWSEVRADVEKHLCDEGLYWDLSESYDDITDNALESADYLRQLSVMLRGKAVLEAIDAPLIVRGCGVAEKDNEALPLCCQVASGENCLFGNVTDKNYRTLVAACLADGHKLIAESPLDINIAKQVNILSRDIGFSIEDIVIYPTTGALGYGLEYAYSIMERGRLAGLGGDALLRQPVLCDVGIEAWRVKEANADEEALPGFGDQKRRGVLWETLTATNHLPAGAELLVLRHPESVRHVKAAIDRLCT